MWSTKAFCHGWVVCDTTCVRASGAAVEYRTTFRHIRCQKSSINNWADRREKHPAIYVARDRRKHFVLDNMSEIRLAYTLIAACNASTINVIPRIAMGTAKRCVAAAALGSTRSRGSFTARNARSKTKHRDSSIWRYCIAAAWDSEGMRATLRDFAATAIAIDFASERGGTGHISVGSVIPVRLQRAEERFGVAAVGLNYMVCNRAKAMCHWTTLNCINQATI